MSRSFRLCGLMSKQSPIFPTTYLRRVQFSGRLATVGHLVCKSSKEIVVADTFTFQKWQSRGRVSEAVDQQVTISSTACPVSNESIYSNFTPCNYLYSTTAISITACVPPSTKLLFGGLGVPKRNRLWEFPCKI